jgi:hypothetical protein
MPSIFSMGASLKWRSIARAPSKNFFTTSKPYLAIQWINLIKPTRRHPTIHGLGDFREGFLSIAESLMCPWALGTSFHFRYLRSISSTKLLQWKRNHTDGAADRESATSVGAREKKNNSAIWSKKNIENMMHIFRQRRIIWPRCKTGKLVTVTLTGLISLCAPHLEAVLPSYGHVLLGGSEKGW